MELVENALLLLEIERNVRCDKVGQITAVLLLHNAEQNIRRHLTEPADVLFKSLLCNAAERFRSCGVACGDRLAHAHAAREVRLTLHNGHNLRALDAFHMQLDAVICGVYHLLDAGDDTDFIEVFRHGLAFRKVSLRDDEQLAAIRIQRRFGGQNGLFSADIKLHDHAGEHDESAYGEYRQNSLFLKYGFFHKIIKSL